MHSLLLQIMIKYFCLFLYRIFFESCSLFQTALYFIKEVNALPFAALMLSLATSILPSLSVVCPTICCTCKRCCILQRACGLLSFSSHARYMTPNITPPLDNVNLICVTGLVFRNKVFYFCLHSSAVLRSRFPTLRRGISIHHFCGGIERKKIPCHT